MFNRVRDFTRPSSSKVMLAIMAGTALVAILLVPGSIGTQSAAAAAATPAGVTPTGINITSGAVCTGASGGESIPASITLPTPYVNNNVDVSLLLDDTGSFSSEWSSVASTFSSVVDQLQAAAPSVTFGFGVSMFKDYGGAWTSLDGDDPQTRPFILNQPIVTSATAGGASALDGLISNAVGLADELPGNGGDTPEASLEGLYQLATGAGFDGNGNGSSLDSGSAGALATQETPGTSGDVPPFSSNVATTSGTLGGIGWRPGALHIVIIATDTSPAAAFPAGAAIPNTITSANGDSEPSINFADSSLTPGDSRTGYVANTTDPATNTVAGAVVPTGGATVQGTVNALNALGIRVVGMGPGDAPTTAEGPGGNSSSIWLSSMARLTGATDSSGNPLVFDTSVDPTTLASSIVSTIQTSAANPVNVGVSASGEAPGVSASFSPSVVKEVAPGSTASTTATIVGPGGTKGNGTFNINFTDAGSGAQLGSIPVTIDCPSTESTGERYVAIGDSYSSGEEGNRYPTSEVQYVAGTNTASDMCHRSNVSYPALIAKLVGGSFADVACSGAVTADLYGTNAEGNHEPAQLCGAAGAAACPSGTTSPLGTATRLVTLTIGGNDAEFSSIVSDCIQLKDVPLTGQSCLDTSGARAQLTDSINALRGSGSATACNSDAPTSATIVCTPIFSLPTILATIHKAAPNAQVYIGGYPLLFGDTSHNCDVGNVTIKLFGLAHTATAYIPGSRIASLNAAANDLDNTIELATKSAGLWSHWVDPRPEFNNHGFCGSQALWFNTVLASVSPNGGVLALDTGSFHPSPTGQSQGYKAAFQRAGI